MGFFDFLFKGRKSSKKDQKSKKGGSSFFKKLKHLFLGKPKLDADLLEQVEELLIATDMGMPAADKLIKKLKGRAGENLDLEKAVAILKEAVLALFARSSSAGGEAVLSSSVTPYVVFVVGVNGTGKTTTIGKLAYFFAEQGKKVMIGAADTFRAAAVDQLKIWGERLNVPVVYQDTQKDPASVAYDAVDQAVKTGIDVLLIDTAGRLHNKEGLMRELAKIKRVIGKKMEGAPHETLLVLDGSTGQNAWQQAAFFNEHLGVQGLVVTKLDGLAKGGVVVGINAELGIPVKYIGTGEGKEDLAPFDSTSFVDYLFKED